MESCRILGGELARGASGPITSSRYRGPGDACWLGFACDTGRGQKDKRSQLTGSVASAVFPVVQAEMWGANTATMRCQAGMRSDVHRSGGSAGLTAR
jgi:hypothetical protein